MILIFDLDDTLYSETEFVKGGFRAVARYANIKWGWNYQKSISTLNKIFTNNGRNKVFDHWLIINDNWSKKNIDKLIQVYRYHNPKINLFNSAKKILKKYKNVTPLYLVTDGNKNVQSHKINSLNLWTIFNRIFITHRYGYEAAKPSIHCFKIIKRKTGVKWSEMIYIGDNPKKDFINLNKIGVFTIRVLTGSYKNLKVSKNYEANVRIMSLDDLPSVLNNRYQNHIKK